MFSTYGVGELRAINALAGLYAESNPVVSLVGTPSRKAWAARRTMRPVHHTLADGRMEVYSKMAREITCAQAKYHEFSTPIQALEAYDEALIHCMTQLKPAYATIPCDMFDLEVRSQPLEKKLSIRLENIDAKFVDSIVTGIQSKLHSSRRPILIVDGLAYPFDLISEARELSQYMPSAWFTSGKGIVDEVRTSGWVETLSGPTEYSSSADLTLMIGPLSADTNTAAWSAIPHAPSIQFNADNVVLDGHQNVGSGKMVLRHLLGILQLGNRRVWMQNATSHNRTTTTSVHEHSPISQDDFWSTMSSFIDPNDTIPLAKGTPLVWGRELRRPPPPLMSRSSHPAYGVRSGRCCQLPNASHSARDVSTSPAAPSCLRATAAFKPPVKRFRTSFAVG